MDGPQRLRLPTSHLVQPRAGELRGVPFGLRRFRELGHDQTRVADDPDVELAVAAQFVPVQVDLDELGRGIDVGLAAVAESEVQRRAEDQHDVGLSESLLARA